MKLRADVFGIRAAGLAAALLALGAAAAGPATLTTRQLSLEESASADHAKPGGRLTLRLEVELKPGMHVYAPGIEGDYIPIEWTMSKAGGAAIDEPKYPAAERLYLKAIGAIVPAYTGRFEITRKVRVDRQAPKGRLVLDGKFRYQACDDRMCYIPQTVPLEWTLKIQ
jgi:DsbC/DsbD-like thiol-disulfide interchange protein